MAGGEAFADIQILAKRATVRMNSAPAVAANESTSAIRNSGMVPVERIAAVICSASLSMRSV